MMAIQAFAGQDIDHDGQRYICAEIKPYKRRDGVSSEVAVWLSRCANCGEFFVFRTGRTIARFQPNRRCDRHKRPGVRVRTGTMPRR